MAKEPPKRLRDLVATRASIRRTVVLEKEERGLAALLKPELVEALDKYLHHRITQRGVQPLSSTAHDAVVKEARDKECRDIVGALLVMLRAPLDSEAAMEQEDG